MGLNPVERRLSLLCGDWLDFRADATKRLLVWQVPENAVRLVQCFFEVQKHDLEYSSRDLFVAFDAPFERSPSYSRALKQALRGQYDASRDDLAAEQLPVDWAFDPEDVPDSPAGVIAALRSFGSKYHQTIGHLAAVLLPSAVEAPEAFAGWIERALAADLPERLRLVVVDSLEHPRFPQLTAERDPCIAVQRPAVDGLATAQETFAQEPTVGPAGVFRNLMMGVVSLVEKGSADQVKAKAIDALAFARKQGWADQEVMLRVLVGGAMLKESRHQEAIGLYRSAREAAAQAVGAGHPAGHKLTLQAWFGEAGAFLAAGDPVEAVRCYDEAAVVAQQDQNAILAIEAFRMGAFCHARSGDRDEAIERGLLAMQLGEGLKPASRSLTTMPLAAVDLLRLLDGERVSEIERGKARLEARLADARRLAEERAVAVEDDPDPSLMSAIEDELERESARARADAEQELMAVVAPADTPFREQFGRARQLLGPDWPLASPMVLAPAGVPPEAPPEGVPAS
jgi:tetratricopeptide (TPR) repeat protein